jgi:hypothetical protein
MQTDQTPEEVMMDVQATSVPLPEILIAHQEQ